jgi:hypothetical protein
MKRDEVHLNPKLKIMRFANRRTHSRMLQIAVADRTRRCRRRSLRAVRVDPQRHNALRVSLHELCHTIRRVGLDRIEQASTLEEHRRRLFLEAILEVAVVVLVRLGMDNERVVDTRLFDKLVVRLERRGWRLVRRIQVVREPLLVIREKVDMRIDKRTPRSGRRGHCCRCR